MQERLLSQIFSGERFLVNILKSFSLKSTRLLKIDSFAKYFSKKVKKRYAEVKTQIVPVTWTLIIRKTWYWKWSWQYLIDLFTNFKASSVSSKSPVTFVNSHRSMIYDAFQCFKFKWSLLFKWFLCAFLL